MLAIVGRPASVCEPGQRVGQLGVGRQPGVGQLDGHPVGPEPLHQPAQLALRVTPGAQRLSHRALAAPGQGQHLARGLLDHLLQVVDRSALLLPAQLGGADHPAERPVALGVGGQQQQVTALRVGHPVLRCGQPEREFGPEHGGHLQLGGRLGEPHHPVHPVVVGERDRVQTEPGGLLDQLLGVAGAVQEAEVGVAVQLGVRGGGRAGHRTSSAVAGRARACGTRPGCRRRRLRARRSGSTRRAGARTAPPPARSTGRPGCSSPCRSLVEHRFDSGAVDSAPMGADSAGWRDLAGAASDQRVGTSRTSGGPASPPIRANSRSAAIRPMTATSWATTVTPGESRSASRKSSNPSNATACSRPSRRSARTAPMVTRFCAVNSAVGGSARPSSAGHRPVGGVGSRRSCTTSARVRRSPPRSAPSR